jgi:hypothetical protein
LRSAAQKSVQLAKTKTEKQNKMKKNLTKYAAFLACTGLLAIRAHANTILGTSNADPFAVGTAIAGVDYGNFGGQTGGDIEMANEFIGVALGGTKTTLGTGVAGANTVYTRSLNPFSLATANATGASGASGTGLNIVGANVEITLGTGFTYLVAKWDGPNGGAMVYDIAGLSAGTVIDVPNVAFGHGMTGFTLLDGTTNHVPDGGTTVLLLGAALSGLGLIRRKLS